MKTYECLMWPNHRPPKRPVKRFKDLDRTMRGITHHELDRELEKLYHVDLATRLVRQALARMGKAGK
jgi:DNA-binding HxlR family transcriptional regulator